MNVKILEPQKSEKSESEKSFLVWCDGRDERLGHDWHGEIKFRVKRGTQKFQIFKYSPQNGWVCRETIRGQQKNAPLQWLQWRGGFVNVECVVTR